MVEVGVKIFNKDMTCSKLKCLSKVISRKVRLACSGVAKGVYSFFMATF